MWFVEGDQVGGYPSNDFKPRFEIISSAYPSTTRPKQSEFAEPKNAVR
jgi:hypothetical protein